MNTVSFCHFQILTFIPQNTSLSEYRMNGSFCNCLLSA